MSATGIVLAGGRSRRMGRDKALLRVQGESILERTIRVVGAVVDGVVVVGRRQGNGPDDIVWLEDERPGCGPLGGLYTGLRHARHDTSIVVACDLPCLDAAVLQRLLASAEGNDAVIPLVSDRVQALHAVYRTTCLPAIERLLEGGTYRLAALPDLVNTRWVGEGELRDIDPDLHSFENANTPEDWRRLNAALS